MDRYELRSFLAFKSISSHVRFFRHLRPGEITEEKPPKIKEKLAERGAHGFLFVTSASQRALVVLVVALHAGCHVKRYGGVGFDRVVQRS